MAQLAILDPRTIVVLKLKQLIERTPLDSRQGLSAPFQAQVKKISAVYVPIEPEEVLLELLIKARSAPKKNWKVEETNYLVYVIDKYCLLNEADVDLLDCADWQNISEYLPGRTADSCQFRFLAIIPSSVTDTPWNHPERQLLLRIIESQEPSQTNWKLVSEKLYELNPFKLYRTGKQCRQHYTCFLRPNLKKGPWTDSEDYQLVCLFLTYGKKWSKMTKHIEGRNENSVKNRFFLMFENRKDGKITNSDLTKIVKRRKEKLEKKGQKISEEESVDINVISEQPVKTETNDQEGNYTYQEEIPPQEQPDSIFEEQTLKYWRLNRNETFFSNSSEEIEKYITF